MSAGTVLRLACAAGCARLVYAALSSRPPGGAKTWTRTNHRNEPVTLLEGPAVAVGAAWAVLTVPGLSDRERVALTVAGIGAGALGCYDDLAGSGDRRGFRGHLGALAHGEVTTGAVKLLGVGAAGLAAAVALGGRGPDGAAGRAAVVDVAINTGLVAGSANLLNLFDLRPGRAIKVLLLAGGALAAAGPQARNALAAPVGAAASLLPEDLGERAMLGDAGANALGAMTGVAAASSLPRPARLAVLAGIVGLTVASEKVSFTKVIARTPVLSRLDLLGRRPADSPVSPADADRPEGGVPLASDRAAARQPSP